MLLLVRRRGEVVCAQGVLGVIRDQYGGREERRVERCGKDVKELEFPELSPLYQNEEQLHMKSHMKNLESVCRKERG